MHAYLKLTCQRKLLCSEKIRSGKNIMLKVSAPSKIDSGYLNTSNDQNFVKQSKSLKR